MAFYTALTYNIITSNRIKANIVVIGQKLLSRKGYKIHLLSHWFIIHYLLDMRLVYLVFLSQIFNSNIRAQ